MRILKDHPLRYDLSNELHARPSPEISGAGQVIYFAISADDGPDAARNKLEELLDKYGETRPSGEANHYYGSLGRHKLKWEMHSEFATYTLFIDGHGEVGDDKGFDGNPMQNFPEDWRASVKGGIITSAHVRVEMEQTEADVEQRVDGEIRNWFVGSSLAAAYTLDRNVVVAGDFRIDESGNIRFAVIGVGEVSVRRMGRIVQRLLEIETYKTMAMLTLPVARNVFAKAGPLDAQLSKIMEQMTNRTEDPAPMLEQLLDVSAEIEVLSSTSAFRFGAGRAYRALVDQRISVLREQRINDRQLFSEFMMRRFDPAMRTCKAAERRLDGLSKQAARASELLGTRVNVATTEQNRQLLESMNKRAALQMRLQETVEGLSVVAVSYYAVNLLVYLTGPLAKVYAVEKTYLAAAFVPPVMLAVWLLVRRIKARVGGDE
ncbi:MAG: DUF3422 domain-containing protein [Alphaproteobacteria bacterium]|nr:DUF3422 domain-containing protein [Alphaproteobacteria bacterium]